MAEDKCCELIDPEGWDKGTFEFKDRLYVRKHYFALFFMPIGIDGVLKRLLAELQGKKLMLEEHPCMLWRHEGMFGGDVLIAVRKEAPGHEMVTLDGRHFTMFFEGKDFKEVGDWHKALKKEMEKRKLEPKEVMSCYLQCPGCAKKFGKMQTILFARL